MATKGTKRRGRGEGSIRLRADGRWEASVARGDGTRKSHYAKTRAEAQSWLNEARRAVETGAVLPDDRQTVAGYLASWLETVAHDLKASTVARHEEIVRCHLIPSLGRLRLAKLTPLHVQSFYSSLLADGLAPATVVRVHAVLHKALEDAVQLDVLARNVCDRVRPPRLRKVEKPVFTVEQARVFLQAVAGDPLEAVYVLALTTGMRQGEVLGLHWRDVDLSCARLRVRQNLQVSRDYHTLYLETPKSDAGRREIPLTPLAVDRLKAHRTRQREMKLAAGAAWRASDFVFTNELGAPIHPKHVYGRFLRICKGADLPRLTFHDLRHTCVTLLREAGVNLEVVSALAGHGDIATTMRIYSHVRPNMLEDAAATLARLFAAS